MKKLINFIILSLLCYLALLIYRGDGVVDFNVVWGEVKTLCFFALSKLGLI